MAATLQLRGNDLRGVIDILAQAIQLADAGERPAVEINGIIYAPDDLGAIAALMPDVPLAKHHRAVVDAVVTDRPADYRSYRRAVRNLARRVADAAASRAPRSASRR
jgi:hypothetical protein